MWDAARPAPCDAAEPSDLAHPAPLPIPPACARLGPLGPGMRRPSALHACQDPPSIRRRGGLLREPGLRWTVHMAGMRGRGAGKRTFCAGRACQWLPDPGAPLHGGGEGRGRQTARRGSSRARAGIPVAQGILHRGWAPGMGAIPAPRPALPPARHGCSALRLPQIPSWEPFHALRAAMQNHAASCPRRAYLGYHDRTKWDNLPSMLSLEA